LTATSRCSGAAATQLALATATATRGDWVELTGELAVPDCLADQLDLQIAGPAAGIDLEVGDVSLRRKPQLGPHLTADPGFEPAASGWFGFAGATVSATTAQAHTGARSGLATGRTATFQGPGYNILAAGAVLGATYQASAWVRVANSALSPVSMT